VNKNQRCVFLREHKSEQGGVLGKHIIHVNGMLVIKRRHMPALHEVNMQ